MAKKGQTTQICVFGLRGSGKSHWAEKFIQKQKGKVAIFDPEHDYTKLAKLKKFIVYNPDSHESDEIYEEFADFIQKVVINFDKEEPKARVKWLVVDECWLVAPPKPRKPAPYVSSLVFRGRHYGLNIIWISQRPVQMNTDIVQLADKIVCFMLKGKNDIEYLNNIVNGFGDTVAQLRKYHYVIFDGERISIHKPIK